MRVLFITRVHPDRRNSRLGRRLHERLCELSELGHEVLVFTQWRGEQIDFKLPKRIEVRFPFRSFKAWEWPMAASLALNWQPEIVHILDPGLAIGDKVFSAEVSTLPLLDGLRLGTRNRLKPRAVVSHLSTPNSHAKTVQFWRNLGAAATESEWLKLGLDSPSFQMSLNEILVDSATDQDTGRDTAHARRRFVLAGTSEDRPDFLESIKSAIEQLFGVKVTGVWTSQQRGKPRRVGTSSGLRPRWKKAIVTLKAGDTIEIFEG
jgi:large subunit ribosomal protein L23